MSLPRIIVTGASGFVGRHLLDEIKETHHIFGLGRRSQRACGAPVHPNIVWSQTDIADREPLTRVFEGIRAGGGADVLLHLAAHYDFTGEEHPEYWRTNVDGLRNVLELAKGLNLRRFVFASSVAACAFPKPGAALDEKSPPDGDHIYARTKRIGEQMVREYSGSFPTCIVRFAALFSDWCEYPPLFMFLETWLSRHWNSHVLGGRGESAIPYLHVRDVVAFLRTVISNPELPERNEILIASPDGAVSHRELFEASTLLNSGRRPRPILMPKLVATPGIYARYLAGRLLGDPPFERPWMASYIDLNMAVDASHSRDRLSWAPRPRLAILRRMPFLLENRKTDPIEWNRLNRAAMKVVELRVNLRIHHLLETHEEEIRTAFTERLVSPRSKVRLVHYERIPAHEHDWHHRLIMRSLMNSIRTREKAVFVSYCHDLAERRFAQGFTLDEVCYALTTLNLLCLRALAADPEAPDLEQLYDHITATIQFGIDEVQDVYEARGDRAVEAGAPPPEDLLWSFRTRSRPRRSAVLPPD
ncbi:MAG TPA: NAD(P)-dependent oxidoreductase [Thermoanaerobaculaceae bacterium]|nr:NAD(P)-dependent oxidoreductase [Thermoanaerobaculaceae bacterium]